jgi:uncharacterized cupredoxin-like copper-binding protein
VTPHAWLAAAPLAAALLAAVAPARGAAAVDVRAGELYFEPKGMTAPAGEVVFVVRNDGAIEHNFVLRDAQGKTLAEVPVIAPGATEQVVARLAPGRYRVLCTLPGHSEAGMVADLVVQ